MNDRSAADGPWWSGLSRYMWWVLAVAGLGWMFDVMDQRIFVLSRGRALDELLSTRLDEGAMRRISLGEMTAAEAERLVGAAPGIAPDARVTIEEPAAGSTSRPVIVFPPLTEKEGPRKLPFIRPRESSGEARVFAEPGQNQFIGRIATAIFLAGWATGGLIFGVLGDKWGRVRTIVLTILSYSLFTGLSAFSVTWVDYSLYRFLTGMGVGGQFAAGAALVAEVMPARSRPYALGLLQALSSLGNILGSLVGLFVLAPASPSSEWDHWRSLYLIGILPALLVVIIIRGRLKEPESWRAIKDSAGHLVGKQLGAFGDLFQSPWRRSTQFGLLFGVSGVIGLWGVAFWTPELITSIVRDSSVISIATALQDVGAFFGIAAITLVTQGAPRSRLRHYAAGLVVALLGAGVARWLGGGEAEQPWPTAALGIALAGTLYCVFAIAGALTGGLGRRVSFVVAFLLALAATILVFRFMTHKGQVYWMMPVLGFSTLLCFGMYAIYFPELYPTRLRTTGTGFCYNVARYVAAAALVALAFLGTSLDLRASTQVFALIYLVGFFAAPFAPETKDRPLAEE